MTPDREMPVSELARRTGVTTAAINFYVRQGLLPKPRKTSRTRAVYDPTYVDLIRRIRTLQDRGFPLRLIAQVLSEPESAGREVLTGIPAGGAGPPEPPMIRSRFLEETGLTPDHLDRIEELGLVQSRSGSGPSGEHLYSRRDVAAGRAVATLLERGADYRLLARHAEEFEPLTRAEAQFLAEHVVSVMRDTREDINRAMLAFATLRDYLRIRQFADAYPEWTPPEPSG